MAYRPDTCITGMPIEGVRHRAVKLQVNLDISGSPIDF